MDYRDWEIWLVEEWVRQHPLNVTPLLNDIDMGHVLHPHSELEAEIQNVKIAVLEWQEKLQRLLFNKLKWSSPATVPYAVRKLGREVRQLESNLDEIHSGNVALMKRVGVLEVKADG